MCTFPYAGSPVCGCAVSPVFGTEMYDFFTPLSLTESVMVLLLVFSGFTETSPGGSLAAEDRLLTAPDLSIFFVDI